MDYKEFRTRVGKITVPTPELTERLFEGADTVHFVVSLGKVENEDYHIFVNQRDMSLFLQTIETLEERGAVREQDYIVCCGVNEETVRLGLHTTHDFLSDEDFDLDVKRVKAK